MRQPPVLVAMRIEELNEKYGDACATLSGDRFFLFHRARRWNPQQGVWMGYERKRGKLSELNALLRGRLPEQDGEVFSLVVGNTSPLRDVTYVITLDTDTQLPRDAARQLVGAMPPEWRDFVIDYRFGETSYHIVVERSVADRERPDSLVTLDGAYCRDGAVVLVDDRQPHRVEVSLPG